MVENIDEFIVDNPELGYKSPPEFIRSAIRAYLKEIKKHGV